MIFILEKKCQDIKEETKVDVESLIENRLTAETKEKIEKKIRKLLNRTVQTSVYIINDQYIANTEFKIGQKLLAVPKCVKINKYLQYLEDLYDGPYGDDFDICACVDEKVHVVRAERVRKEVINFTDLTIRSISKERVCLNMKIKDNTLTRFFDDSLRKIGENAVRKIYGDFEVQNVVFNNGLYINRKDIYINKWSTAVY